MKKVELWAFVHDFDDMCDVVHKYHVRNTRDGLELINSGVMSETEVLRISLEDLFINYRLEQEAKK